MSSSSYIHGTHESERQRLSALNAATNARFLGFLAPGGARRILEVGSGLGILAEAVAGAAAEASVVGVEYSLEQLAHARRSAPNLQLQQGDAHALGFADASFDLVYARYVLEHLRDPALALSEMRRVLVPGGRVVLQENDNSLNRLDPPAPAFEALWRAFALQQAQLGGDGSIGVRLFRLLVQAGFRDVELSTDPEVHWFGSPGFDAWLANIEGLVAGAGPRLLASGLVSPELLTAAAAELRRLRLDPEASATFHWNRARAVRSANES